MMFMFSRCSMVDENIDYLMNNKVQYILSVAELEFLIKKII